MIGILMAVGQMVLGAATPVQADLEPAPASTSRKLDDAFRFGERRSVPAWKLNDGADSKRVRFSPATREVISPNGGGYQ
jgi:hypothetical protein